MKILADYVRHVCFAWLSLIESLLNIVIYTLLLNQFSIFKNGVDLAIPFWAWYTNAFMKPYFLEDARNGKVL